MPDTGAPWNIPFLDGTELVRAYPQASEDLADAVAAGLSAAGNAGIGSNVVQTVKTDTFTSTSRTFVTVTGLTATITPSTDTSKILVMTGFTLNGQPGQSIGIARLMRASTPIFIGDAAGNRVQGFVGVEHPSFQMQTVSAMFVDAPTTDAAVTYSVQVRTGASGSVRVNIPENDPNTDNRVRTAASLILIEVAA